MAVMVAAVVAALVVGFLAGLLAFRVKSRWCPACGGTTVPLAERSGQSGAGAASGEPQERQVSAH